MQTYRKDSISLNGFKNAHTLIYFWATWMEDAYNILDRVNDFYDKYGRKNDIKIISISSTARNTSGKVTSRLTPST